MTRGAPRAGEASHRGTARAPAAALALGVGLVLSDSSVVTLALPAILRELDATVSSVAWVLVAFNVALALAAVPGWLAARRRPRAALGLSCAAFAAASVVCATAPTLGVLVAARAAQGVVGAVLVAAALELLLAGLPRRRAIGLWAGAGVLGGAVGPALGGALTEAFSWEAMFALQAPVVLVALLGLRRRAAEAAPADGAAGAAPPPECARIRRTAGPAPAVGAGEAAPPPDGTRVRWTAEPAPLDWTARAAHVGRAAAGGASTAAGVKAAARPPALAPLVALALTSAALAAALFLLVILLIEGWRMSPGEAALVVTAMPLAALAAGRRARAGLAPALPGGVLLAGGLAALGVLPGSGAPWTIVPQLAIGAGLGLSLAALVGATIGDGAVGRPAARTIAARHAGIVAGLLVLTPIFAHDLDAARDPAERAGVAHLLDAPIALEPKIALARSLAAQVANARDQELPDLDAGFAAVPVPPADRAAVAALHDDLEDEIDRAATQAFARSFLAAALLALLAAAAAAVAILAARPRAPPASVDGHRGATLRVALPGACALAALLVAAYVGLGGATYGPTPVADPCAARERPVDERAQRIALATIDGAACALGRGREELLLALLDGERPNGVSGGELSDALVAGVDRAQREGELGGLAATALRLAVRAAGATGIVGLLVPD